MRLGGSVLFTVAVFGSLAHLLRRRLLPASAREPADRQGQQQDSSSPTEHTALPAPHSYTAAQQAVKQLQDVYASMAAAFSAAGLDLGTVAETAAWFETGPPAPWPRRYSSFLPHPLPPGSVRLVVVPLADNCPRLASMAAAAAADILSLLSPGCKVFSNARQNLHITVFHFSHPADTRPDALDARSGLHCMAAQQGSADTQQQPGNEQQQQQQQQQQAGHDNGADVLQEQQHNDNDPLPGSQHQPSQLPRSSAGAAAAGQAQLAASQLALLPVHQRPGPTAQQLAAEQEAAAAVVAATPPFTLQFERVLLARSGVLLLTWSDPSGALARLRGSLHSSFPGACRKQSIIIHTSLFRIVGTPAVSDVGSEQPGQQQQQLLGEDEAAGAKLSAAAVANISAACEQWTQQLRGTRLAVSTLWWVCEEEFSSIQGQRLPLACCSKALPN